MWELLIGLYIIVGVFVGIGAFVAAENGALTLGEAAAMCFFWPIWFLRGVARGFVSLWKA
jgi:hypothetical protein